MDRKQAETTEAGPSQATSKKTGILGRLEDKFGPKIWTILLALVAAVICYFGIYSPSWENPTLAEFVNRCRDNWLWVLIFSGILYFLIKRIAGESAKTLHGVLLMALIAIFFALPVWFWLVSPSGSGGTKSTIPLVRELPVAERPKLVLPPKGKSKRIPVPQGMHVVMSGEDFRFHCVYQDGHEESFGAGESACSDGNMPFVYATNNREKEQNIVSYAYATK
ncbi:MAG: hypothetical protein WC776_05400 [Patescibacteria group bacterium]